MRKYWRKSTHKTIWGKWLGGAALFLVIVALGCSGGEEKSKVGKTEAKTAATAPTATETPVAPETLNASQPNPVATTAPGSQAPGANVAGEPERAPASLGMSSNEFGRRFNQRSEQVKSKLRIHGLKIAVGAGQNSFQQVFNENLYLTGKVNKADGSVAEINLVGVLNGSLATTVDLNLGIGTIITAVDPGQSQEGRDSVLNLLGINKITSGIYNLEKQVTRNGVIYWVKSSRKAGLHFGVKSASAT